jgi:predicted enzyme related to lactoylglutathione lyase
LLDLNSVTISSAKPKELAAFYEKVFKRAADWADEGWYGWEMGSAWLHIGGHSEVSGKAKEPARIMLNFQTRTVKAEFERIKGLGAKVIAEPYEMDGTKISTFADADGNYFQLMSPWK